MARKNIMMNEEYLNYIIYIVENSKKHNETIKNENYDFYGVYSGDIATFFNQNPSNLRNKMNRGLESKNLISAKKRTNGGYYYSINFEGISSYLLKFNPNNQKKIALPKSLEKYNDNKIPKWLVDENNKMRNAILNEVKTLFIEEINLLNLPTKNKPNNLTELFDLIKHKMFERFLFQQLKIDT